MPLASTRTFPYWDASLSTDERVEDLLGRMTLREKAGLFFHQMIEIGEHGALAGPSDAYALPGTEDMLLNKQINHFNVLHGSDPRTMAEWHNKIQERALSTRLGIPVTLSTDPRHAFTDNPGASFTAGSFSQWPESLGLAAIGDEKAVYEFADIARQEYLAVGLRIALHPQIDLATEPRWARIGGTFGEDAELTSRLLKAYIRGFQTDQLGFHSVATMVKHFPGGGPQKDGEDPHFPYGREQVYPGQNFDYHLLPFEAAFEAGTSQVMPYYGMPVGTQYEEVAFGFNEGIITGLLRQKYGFDGVVCADWNLIHDSVVWGEPQAARAWGVEHLSPSERLEKAISAGVDQFGGEHCPELIVELVNSGRLSEARIDVSARRVLREKFILGLFDNPFVDPDLADKTVAKSAFVEAGYDAQCQSLTVLTNGAETAVLPIAGQPKIFVLNMDPAVAARYGTITDTPEQADIAVVRIKAPYEPRQGAFEQFFHAGSLEFTSEDLAEVLGICSKVPTVVDIYLDRPAIIPEIVQKAAAVVANYGASDQAVLDVLFGRRLARGRLPFDLPSSTRAVEASRTDVPFDTDVPLFRFGYGLTVGGGDFNQ